MKEKVDGVEGLGGKVDQELIVVEADDQRHLIHIIYV